MYDPALGRFLQPDPIGTAGGLNLYAYTGNDPLNFTDPLGLQAEGPTCRPACYGTNIPSRPNITRNFGAGASDVIVVTARTRDRGDNTSGSEANPRRERYCQLGSRGIGGLCQPSPNGSFGNLAELTFAFWEQVASLPECRNVECGAAIGLIDGRFTLGDIVIGTAEMASISPGWGATHPNNPRASLKDIQNLERADINIAIIVFENRARYYFEDPTGRSAYDRRMRSDERGLYVYYTELPIIRVGPF